MRMTRLGVQAALFYLALLVAFFSTPYSNLFFLLLGFLTLCGLTGIGAAFRNVRGIEGLASDSPPVPANSAIEVPLAVRARRRVRFGLLGCLDLERGVVLVGRLDHLDERGTLVLTSPGLARGRHAVRRTFIESTFPFGVLRARRKIAGPRALVVYPEPSSRFLGRSLLEVRGELLGPRAPEAGDLQPAGLRDHREGEGLRGVHWRASARRGKLVMKEWEGGNIQGLEVQLDRRCAPEALEEALSTLSAVVLLTRAGKETLRLHTQDLSATFGEGHRPWNELLCFLAEADRLTRDAPAPPPVALTVLRLPLEVARAS